VTRIAISRDFDSRSAHHEYTQKGANYTHIGYDFQVPEEKGAKSATSPRGYLIVRYKKNSYSLQHEQNLYASLAQ
jgi:hypothetical protein